jgi:hypothetical protein
MKYDNIVPVFERMVKSNGFAVVVMFGMMTAMAYTLWNQYNRMNDRLTALEQEIVECYKENAVKSNVLIEKNTKVMEEVIFHLQNQK